MSTSAANHLNSFTSSLSWGPPKHHYLSVTSFRGFCVAYFLLKTLWIKFQSPGLLVQRGLTVGQHACGPGKQCHSERQPIIFRGPRTALIDTHAVPARCIPIFFEVHRCWKIEGPDKPTCQAFRLLGGEADELAKAEVDDDGMERAGD